MLRSNLELLCFKTPMSLRCGVTLDISNEKLPNVRYYPRIDSYSCATERK